MSRSAVIRFVVLVSLAGAAHAQGLPDTPTWGRAQRPEGANQLFATHDGCALCHSATERAIAMRGPTGHDISPVHLWQGSMMANSFKDPYWRAQVSKATLAHPERAAEIEKLCTTCHAPMPNHTARIAGFQPMSIRDMEGMALAEDGVSCTVCHQAQADNLGTPASFNGRLDIRPGRKIFGPYQHPIPGPMRMHTAFTPTHGAHIRSAGLCGSCHTLETHHAVGAEGFQEQTPYLEWLNSDFADGGSSPQTCQECHMPDYGSVRIARAPHGGDFNIKARPHYRGHTFHGGNAYMLDILEANREALGIHASSEALKAAARATRKQLADHTAAVTIENQRIESGRLMFSVKVENKTGHKLPSGYPSRRLWMSMEVRLNRETIFVSGGYDERGRLTGVKNPLSIPHVQTVTRAEQIPVWETVVLDADGKPTTELVSMARYGKDNRLLPRGWKPDGPHAAKTRPVGVGDDTDFRAGSDTVHYSLALPENTSGNLQMIARLHYQSIPPAWAEDLKNVDSKEARTFTRIYEKMPTRTEIVGLTVSNLTVD